ncbi:hypothetical protein [Phenylobacterium sp.]|uniref:hypothetical protein n=1 Tax=Phenylobacterium sp. TaxID=1871053 RepID=UPI0027187058|nr:hypothetical protein [Phenylobacterium sp.]MDO8380719.1 hypothetical protein [Phenylobacterium sp.]
MKTIIVLAAAAALSASSALAQPPPNPNCKTQAYGAPTLITGTAQASQQQQAQMGARSNWSAKASAFGGAYTFWNKAANKSTNCQSSKPAFTYVYKCTATAQPCR